MDNTSLMIEKMALELGSYIKAVVEFAEKFPESDFEDIKDTLHPNLLAKLEQEYVSRGYLPKLKKDNLFSFLDDEVKTEVTPIEYKDDDIESFMDNYKEKNNVTYPWRVSKSDLETA